MYIIYIFELLVGADIIRPCKCAVSDVRLSVLIIMSEFTSVNVARVQRHAAVAMERRLCAVGAAFGGSQILLKLQITLGTGGVSPKKQSPSTRGFCYGSSTN